jgi:predicted nucleotidyltransferase
MSRDDILQEVGSIVKQLVTKYKPLKIILFGSAAQEKSRDVNDLDFLIIKEDVPFYGIDRIRELDGLIERRVATDMIVYRPDELEERVRLGDPFVQCVLEEGKVLYG